MTPRARRTLDADRASHGAQTPTAGADLAARNGAVPTTARLVDTAVDTEEERCHCEQEGKRRASSGGVLDVRRTLTTVFAAGAVALLTLGPVAPTTAAMKPASFAATLSDDGACGFTLTATWSGAKVAQVIAQWHIDGAYWATSAAPGTGPNGGTIKGRTATFHAGPLTVAAEPHASQALVQFYSAGGANLGETWSNVDTAACRLGS